MIRPRGTHRRRLVTPLLLCSLCFALAACASRSDRSVPVAREVVDGPYTLAYRIFAGDYTENGPVFARLAADLRAAGVESTRSVGIFLKDRLCVCGAVIEQKDWPRIESLPPSFRILHIPRAARMVCQYPVTGPASYIEGGAICYPILRQFARTHQRSPVGSFEVYDALARTVSYVARTLEKESDYPEVPAGLPTEIPSWQDPDWQASTPEAQGMDSLQLARALDLVPTMWDLGEIDSLLITRHGRMVLEVYFHPNRAEYLHELHSVTKSVTSTLMGIAVQNGLVRMDDPVLTCFPGRQPRNASADKTAMTVRNLLDMQSGLEFQQYPLIGVDNTHARLFRSTDWPGFCLDLPMAVRPGARFNYSDGDMAILSGILARTTGGRTAEFAEQGLFSVLGINSYVWRKDPRGNPIANDGLFLTARDQAKIGYLYLRGGTWKGRRLLPESWVRDIRTRGVSTEGRSTVPRYGMLWWVDRTGSLFSASGLAGQYIIVMPGQDIVAVVNAKQGAVTDDPGFLEIVHELILPAVKANGALPENANGVAELQERVHRFQSPRPRPVPALPETAGRISGRRILLDPNPVGVPWVILRFESGEASLETERNGTAVRVPIGLDGIQRTSGPIDKERFASLGFWDDAETFRVVSRVLQGDFLNRLSFRFLGDTALVTLTISDEAWQSFSVPGRLAD